MVLDRPLLDFARVEPDRLPELDFARVEPDFARLDLERDEAEDRFDWLLLREVPPLLLFL